MTNIIQINQPCDVCRGEGRILFTRERGTEDPRGTTTGAHQFDEGNLYAVLLKANAAKDKRIKELEALVNSIKSVMTEYDEGKHYAEDSLVKIIKIFEANQ